MQYVERTAPEPPCILPAQLRGSLQGGAPQEIGLAITAFGKNIVERGQCRLVNLISDDAMTCGQANGIDELHPPVVRNEK